VHTLELIDEAAKHMDMLLFIEYAKGRPKLEHVKKIYCQKFTLPGLSFVERALCFVWFRLFGWRNLYVHYSYWSGLIGGLIYRASFGKFYYWHCEAYADYGADRKWFDWKWKLLDDIPMRLCMKLCSFLMTGTGLMRDFYAKIFHVSKRKIKVMPNSINLERFQPGEDKKSGQIVFVHWLAPRKGADLLPDIVRKCLRDHTNLSFVIIGEGPLEKLLKEEFEEMPQVEMTGVMPNDKVREIVAESDLLILPSRQEGFPRVLIESMALGTAFVATDVGGVKDIVPEECHLIEPENEDEFAKEVSNLISDSNLRKNLVKSGLHKVKEFSHVKVAKLFEALI